MSDSYKARNSKERFAIIYRYLGLYKPHLILGSVSMVLANALLLITPYLIKLIIDDLETGGGSSRVISLVFYMVGLTVLAGIFRFIVRRTIIWMSRHLEYHIRSALFSHLLKLNPSFYHQTRTGDVMARTTNDLEAIRMLVGPGFMHLVNTVVSLVIAAGFMLYMSPRLTLYAFLPMIVFPWIVNKMGNLVHLKFIKIQEQFSRMTVVAQENLSGIRVIKAYRQEEAETQAFGEESEEYVRLNLNMARLQGLLFPLIRFLAAGINLIILGVGGYEVINGDMPLGTLVAFLTYVNALFWPMFAMGWVVSIYQRGTASLDRVNRILHTEPLVTDNGGDARSQPMHGHIKVENLTFAYNDRPVLKEINMEIKPGQTIGLIGTTGSGKTTLVSLLAHLFPVKPGMISIDGLDINDWPLGALRDQIGFATQEPFLFSDTIEGNIRLGRPEAKPEEVVAAARMAALEKDLLEFPDGYQTMVGERGITLSGGQKQRTAIARALIGNPRILILDDVTSAVDTETEDEILNQLEATQNDRTRIIISHRVSSVKSADRVYFMDDGRIVEEGSHEELIELNGRYAELYRAQLLQQELEAL